jgi:hypothetical protein
MASSACEGLSIADVRENGVSLMSRAKEVRLVLMLFSLKIISIFNFVNKFEKIFEQY